MKMKTRVLLFMALLVCTMCANALTVTNLRMNTYSNPIGIDVQSPTFSWTLSSQERGVMQKSYAIEISTDKEFKLNVWKSGVISSEQSVDVKVFGFVAQPRTRYYWRVSVVDTKGKKAISTEKAYFETGLMNERRWFRSQWIKAMPIDKHNSRIVDYELDVDFDIKQLAAGVIFAAKNKNNYYMWQVSIAKDKPLLRPHIWHNANGKCIENKPIDIDIKAGETHHLKIVVENARIAKTYIDGKIVDTREGDFEYGNFGFRQCEEYDIRKNEQAYFDNFKVTSNGKTLIEDDFSKSKSIFKYGEIVGGRFYVEGPVTYSFQNKERIVQGELMLRKTFETKKAVKSARLYSTALGVYNVFINGERVCATDDDGNKEEDELKPGFTEALKTVFYTTHDVTSLLKEGKNAIGAEVSSGWWNGNITHGMYGACDNAFRGMLIITYEDDSEETISTDTSWKSSFNGPLRYGDIYDGEVYDARLAHNWSSADYDDSKWSRTDISKDFKGHIRAFEGPIVKAVPEFARLPKTITIYDEIIDDGTTYGAIKEKFTSSNSNERITLKPGETAIYDMGQNAAGWVSFEAKGEVGTELMFRFGEMLNTSGARERGDDGAKGSLYVENLRGAEACLHYTMSGSAEGEKYHPTSTFFGFRYVEVTTTKEVELYNVVGETVTSAMVEKSSFSTSHKDVNQLYSNVVWGERSNFLSIPTDCPQRDERQGWSADTQVYSMAGLYIAEARSFYEKWMRDMRDSQDDNGAFPHIAPYAWGVGHGAAAWADAGVIVPWNVYLMTGDKKIIEENWESMEKYMQFLETRKGGGYLYNGGETTYGDWVSFANTDSRFCSVSYYAYDAQLMEKMARVLSVSSGDNYAAKAQKYHELYENIKKEWQRRYCNEQGIPNIDTQCAYLMALQYNLLDGEESVNLTKEMLRKNIENNGNKLNTGFLGTAILNQTLTKFGMNDLAYTLLLQRECPSWLYSVDQGATTIWERWNSYTIKDGFGPVSMNSFNHYAYGIVAEWMYRYMAGIAPDEAAVGFKHFVLEPNIDDRKVLPEGQERITNVDATFNSPYGEIKAAWDNSNGKLQYNVSVPANTTATIYLPVADVAKVKESGKKLSSAKGVKVLGVERGKVKCELGSGDYSFLCE